VNDFASASLKLVQTREKEQVLTSRHAEMFESLTQLYTNRSGTFRLRDSAARLITRPDHCFLFIQPSRMNKKINNAIAKTAMNQYPAANKG